MTKKTYTSITPPIETYCIDRNFGGKKLWRIWRIACNSPKFFSPFFCIITCVNTLYNMSIRKYFKPVQKDVSLPNPHGPLSSKVPSGAIEAANDRVSETVTPSGSGSGNMNNTARGPYTKLTPAQRLMIGKRASEHGTTATMKYFSKEVSWRVWFSKRDHSSTTQKHIPD